MARRHCIRRGRNRLGNKTCRKYSGSGTKSRRKSKRRCFLSEFRNGRRICLKYGRGRNPYLHA